LNLMNRKPKVPGLKSCGNAGKRPSKHIQLWIKKFYSKY
jgi:hypothetical protein